MSAEQGATAQELRALGALLGIATEPDDDATPTLVAAAWEDLGLWLSVRVEGATSQRVLVQDTRAARDAFARATHLALSLEGSGAAQGVDVFVRALAERCGVTWDEVCAAFAPPDDAKGARPDDAPRDRPAPPATASTDEPGCAATSLEVGALPALFGMLGPLDRGRGQRLAAAEWRDDRLLVEVETPGAPPASLFIEARRDDRPAYRCTRHLAVSYENRAFTPALAAVIDAFVVALGERSMDALREALPPSMHFASSDGDDHEPGTFGADDSVSRRWRGAGQWHRFFASRELDRNVQSALRFAQEFIEVEHGDRECGFAKLTTRHPVPTFVDYPWRRDVHAGHDTASDEAQITYTTDMDESDAVMGGLVKLERLLDGVRDKHRGRRVRVNVCCLPMVIGDDYEPVIERFAEDHDQPVVLTTQETHEPVHGYGDAIRIRCDAPAPDGINLVGYGDGVDAEELEALLRDAGLRPNVRVLPDAREASLQGCANARAQVFLPIAPWRSLYASVFRKLPLVSIEAPGPYGLEGTRAWMRAIGDALEARPELDRAFDAAMSAVRPELDALRARAAGQRLGFVLERSELRRLLDPERMMGMDLLPLLDELGFAVDVLCFEGDFPCAERASEVLSALPNGAAHRVSTFARPEELDEALRASAASAFFSEYRFDPRLSRAGKGQFACATFEKGLRGAVRSLRRLVELSQLPFYRRYARHLAAARA